MSRRTTHVAERLAAGFTIIELLVVVSIIVLIISMVLPAMRESRLRAKEVVCATDQRTLGESCLLYAADWNRELPDLSAKPGVANPTYSGTLVQNYWSWSGWRDYMEKNYYIGRDSWYSLTNPRWNRADFYHWANSVNGKMVMGRFYFTTTLSNTNSFYNGMSHAWTTVPAPDASNRPLFARRLTDNAYWDIMWTDLNRQWPASAGTTWITPDDPNRYGANHMYEHKDQTAPAGSHVFHLDGHSSWTTGRELECRSVHGGVEYYW